MENEIRYMRQNLMSKGINMNECTCAAKTYKTVTSYEAWNNEEKLVLKL